MIARVLTPIDERSVGRPAVDAEAPDAQQPMPLTRDFKETVRARARREPGFREKLLKSAVRCMLNGEVEVGRIILADYVNSGEDGECLIHMLSDGSDSSAGDLLGIVAAIAKHEGIELDVLVTQRSHAEQPLAA